MKKYNRPELSISLFDVEDVITKSGIVDPDGYSAAAKQYGTLYTDQGLQTPAQTDNSVVYFTWK